MNKSSTFQHAHQNNSKADRLLSGKITRSFKKTYGDESISSNKLKMILQYAAAYESVESRYIGSLGNLMN